MSFFNPEDDLEVYNKLEEYNNIADDLESELNANVEFSIKQKQDILFPIIEEIKTFASLIVDEYIMYLNNKEDQKLLTKLENDINTIIEEIDIFKNKVYEIYKNNNKEN